MPDIVIERASDGSRGLRYLHGSKRLEIGEDDYSVWRLRESIYILPPTQGRGVKFEALLCLSVCMWPRIENIFTGLLFPRFYKYYQTT